jgi:Cd(II)/Pb(II)-responsive transcriptional regulator
MKIGELAQRADCLVETIRYYERTGLLMAPERSANNYRSYGEHHAERLVFIRHCRALDMTLDEIKLLLQFRDHPMQDCVGVNDLLDKHIEHVVSRMAALSALEAQLRQIRSRCSVNDATSECAILQALGTQPVCGTNPSP